MATTHPGPGNRNPDDAIGESILKKALTRTKGRHRPYCVREEPKRAYYVSNLAPTHGVEEHEEFTSQINPSAITLKFKPKDLNGTLERVAVEFDVYYPSHPTYEEYQVLVERSRRGSQIEEQRGANFASDSGAASQEDGEALDPQHEVGAESLYALNEDFYRRVTVTYEDSIDLSNDTEEAASFTNGLQSAVEEAISEATDEVKATQEQPESEDYPDLDLWDLSEADFGRVVGDLDPAPNGAIQWNVEFQSLVQTRGPHHRDNQVALRLMNCPVGDKDDPHNADEPHLFNPKITVEATIDSYEFNLGPDDYRFDQHIRSKGSNCSTSVESLDSDSDRYRVETTATPRSEVYEFEFNTDYDTQFEALAGDASADTVEVLEDIAEGMDDYLDAWVHRRLDAFLNEYDADEAWEDFKDGTRMDAVYRLANEEPDDSDGDWDGPWEVAEFVRSAVKFDEERERFRSGIEVLENEEDVLTAFQMMNEVNHRIHWKFQPAREGFEGWRLFQLVFIVSNLSSIVARDPADRYQQYASEYDHMAEVLWFPTGGGKTEAYVGLVLFNLFFDRLRGKDNGVTAWIRFPLRLLSRQQKARFMRAILVAEDMRTDPADAGGLDATGAEFSLGYFPGSQDSPNAIGTSRDNRDETYAAASTSEHAREQFERECNHLDECPLCGSEVVVRYAQSTDSDDPVVKPNGVYHYCTGDALGEGEECIDRIPLFVVDRDIYRHSPSVLLGSLDKIAVMGMQPRFANLLGNFTTECPIHGRGYSGRCPEKDVCEFEDNSDEFSDVEPGTREDRDAEFFDPVPTLHLIDEVHLLNEELGAFASHYETTYLSLCEEIGDARPKLLTSTATIAEYDRQIENLFQTDATRFPEEGPTLGETFYGELNEQKVERAYHGLTPNNKTHLYAVLDLIKQYHEVVRDYHGMSPDELVREVVRGYHVRNPGAALDGLIAEDALALDPNGVQECVDENLDTLVAQAGWTDGFDADEQAEVLDRYMTSLVYFTNKREKDTYRKNIGKQIHDEMKRDGYMVPIEDEQLTADTEDEGILTRLEDPEDDWRERIDTVPATSFVGHGIDVPRFNFMTFFGYPDQTFQYIQSSSRVGRQANKPGHVLGVFRPFDKRDRHRYKYFEKLHEYLSRTVEPVPIDRWAKFAVDKTFPGVFMSIILQYYRPMAYRKRDDSDDPFTLGSGAKEQRVNLQNADHLYEAMHNDRWFPELTKEALLDASDPDDSVGLLAEAYGLNNDYYTNDYFVERVEKHRDDIWRYWTEHLDTDMDFPEWPDGEGPMINLRDIGTSGDITAYSTDGTSQFIEGLSSK